MNNMGLFNDWLLRNGYDAVARWEFVDGKRELVPLRGEDGQLLRVSPAAIVEYMVKMAHGDAQARPAVQSGGAGLAVGFRNRTAVAPA